MDEQQQEQAAFERGFAETAGIEMPASTATDDVVAEAPEPKPEVKPQNEPKPDSPESPKVSATPEANAQPGDAPEPEPAANAPAQAPEDDPVLLDGLKRSELHRLLSNAAEVEGLKRQLDKAHGNIGELNRKLQTQLASTPAPAAPAPELTPELKQFEEDFPEVAQYVKALGITQQKRPEASAEQPPVQSAVAAPAQAPVAPDALTIEIAVMDRMHPGWRDKAGSQDFNLWMAAQGESAQQAFVSATTADEMAAVIGQFDQWVAARTAAADKTAKVQQRLKAAVTPAGNAARPQAAPTELEAMEAAFKRTLGL